MNKIEGIIQVNFLPCNYILELISQVKLLKYLKYIVRTEYNQTNLSCD